MLVYFIFLQAYQNQNHVSVKSYLQMLKHSMSELKI